MTNEEPANSNPLEEEACFDEEFFEPFPGIDVVPLDENQLDIDSGEGLGNILIVEDDQFIAKEYGFMLTAHGFRVSYAYDADQAVKAIYLFGNSFDFIVLDIRMYYGNYMTAYDTAEGRRTGAILSQEMREYASASIIVGLSNSHDAFDKAWFEANYRHLFCNKSEFSPILFAKYLHTIAAEENDSIKKNDDDYRAIDEWKDQLLNSLTQNNNLIIQYVKEQTMGDKYEAGQVGAQGKHAHAHDMVFNQVWSQNKDSWDLKQLSTQLSELREALAKEASKQQDYIEIGNVASAELEVSNGNGAKALEYLKKTGSWTLSVAEKIGVGVATAAIKTSLGI
ncbi:hypothetical protein L2750_13565 [Shewanella submarina]|uniref:Response regulatory domain-containing protein n=1 Tax=Shewanella submarina TaxID=2016376 RepID=A0ABV7GHM8_9GAMM|nr:hypothetical protein [Shewanella submarina]MCL1038174.1 hypothetical protein [Shewanella submarina]